ncbi:MAG: hypothetical protein IKC80_01280 [Kiritimatiellae bacterium]|nr:hypothetical protein [Kiritimatiellia bacterium]
MDCTVTEARELVGNGRLWPKVKAYLAAGGEFALFPANDPSRLKLLDGRTRSSVGRWVEALAAADGWRTVVDGAKVRELKAEYAGVYPEVFRYEAYFRKWRGVLDEMSRTAAEKGCRVSQVDCPDFGMILLLLKLKFPEAYELCCS